MKYVRLHNKKMHEQMRVLRIGDSKPVNVVIGSPIAITQKAVVEGPRVVEALTCDEANAFGIE
jgi:hypothetical protein